MRKAICKTQLPLQRALIAVAALCFANGGHAESLFDAHSNLSPVSALFLLDSNGLASGDGVSVHWQTASHSARETAADAAILLDGETSRLQVAWHKRLEPRWSVGASVAHVWHARGTLDGFINDWHATFGLPDGIRDSVAKGQLQFLYSEGGDDRLGFTRTRDGTGDLTLRAQRTLGTTGDWALVAQVKLPSGSLRDLSGSGATDYGLNLVWQPPVPERRGWSYSAGAGLVALGKSDLALVDQSRLTWVAHGEVRYRVNARVDLGGRVQGHGALSDSTLDILGSPALWLVTGGEIRVTDQWRIHISVSEDIKVESAPDVSFNLALHHNF